LEPGPSVSGRELTRSAAATIALALLAVVLLAAGTLTWRMTAANCHRMSNGRGIVCPHANEQGVGMILTGPSFRHRTHPRGAEVLWAAGGAAALAALAVEIRRRRPPG
jgi:hypothetical protein